MTGECDVQIYSTEQIKIASRFLYLQNLNDNNYSMMDCIAGVSKKLVDIAIEKKCTKTVNVLI